MFIILNRDDGGVSIKEIPVGFDCEAFIAEWLKSAPWKVVSYHIAETLPEMDYCLRNAWTYSGDDELIKIDIEKAKPVFKSLMRTKALQRVKKDTMGNQDFSVVTPEIEAIDLSSCKTVEEIKAHWPASIEQRNAERVELNVS